MVVKVNMGLGHKVVRQGINEDVTIILGRTSILGRLKPRLYSDFELDIRCSIYTLNTLPLYLQFISLRSQQVLIKSNVWGAGIRVMIEGRES